MKMIFEKGMEEIDFSESYYKIAFLGKEVLVISFINLWIRNHELNPTNIFKFLDKAVAVFEEIGFLKINNCTIVEREIETESIYLGGFNLDLTSCIHDIEIRAKKSYINLVGDSKLSTNYWKPELGLFAYESNIARSEVEAFFNTKNLASDIKHIMQSNIPFDFCSMYETQRQK